MSEQTTHCTHCGQVEQPFTADLVDWAHMVHGKLITLRAITQYRCSCGDSPEVIALGPLLRGITACPDTHQTWARIDGQWVRET